jgi:protein-S-isoprenylcysteine O-methyltransferase Ste14
VHTCAYVVCAGIWVIIIWRWLIPVARKHQVGEIYAACGVGILSCSVVLGELVWGAGGNQPMRCAGWLLYIPAAGLVISSFITLGHQGKPDSGWEHTTRLVRSGVYGIVRHPLFLGSSIFMLGSVLVLQLVQAVVLGLAAVFCFWMASRKEDAFNMEKFGDAYRKYMDEVPMWNIFRRRAA